MEGRNAINKFDGMKINKEKKKNTRDASYLSMTIANLCHAEVRSISTVLFIVLLFVSCHKKVTSAITQTDVELRSLNYVPAKVVLQTELAGCGYMLALEDGKMLEPLNLADTLKQNNLRLWIKYHIEKNAMSVCMMGTIVKVDDVKFVK